MVTRTNPTLAATTYRMSQAHVAYGKLAAFWRAVVAKSTGLDMFLSYVVPVLLYDLSSTLTPENRHLSNKTGVWYCEFLERVVGLKASQDSRIPS